MSTRLPKGSIKRYSKIRIKEIEGTVLNMIHTDGKEVGVRFTITSPKQKESFWCVLPFNCFEVIE